MNENISIAGALIALCSLAISFYVMFRDKRRIDIEASYLNSFEHMADGIYLKVVNSGRRPVTLHKLVFGFSDGDIQETRIHNSINERLSTPFEKRDDSHPCLSESQIFEIRLDSTNFHFDEMKLDKLIFLKLIDSTGKSKKLTSLANSIKTNAKYLKGKI